jgi:LysM repeat protein
MPRTTICRSSLSLALAWALVLAVPAAAGAQDPAPPATHTVRAGDTLWELAGRYLGNPYRWQEIYRLNESAIPDPGRLQPGQVLRLPSGAGAAPAPEGPPAEPGEPAAAAPPADEPWGAYPLPEFTRRQTGTQAVALQAYVAPESQPLRLGEFYAAAFLTEEQALPLGQVLGPVTPPQIRNLTERQSAAPGTTIGIRPPPGASYALGDTLLLFVPEAGFPGYGDMVVPTGLARVTGEANGHALALVVALYGPVRQGQSVLPAEPYVPGPMSQAVPATDTLRGAVLGARSRRELKMPQTHLFINLGRENGVMPGDLVEIRRRPGIRGAAAVSIDELMAWGQVVRAGARSATVLLLHVESPDIAPGTPVYRVAALPR